jgi:hypothetical protein
MPLKGYDTIEIQMIKINKKMEIKIVSALRKHNKFIFNELDFIHLNFSNFRFGHF